MGHETKMLGQQFLNISNPLVDFILDNKETVFLT
jgi:hypothetical protein